MDVRQYLDSTYLKTASQVGIDEEQNIAVVKQFIQEAIDENFKLVMIRPDKVALAKEIIFNAKSQVGVGTVIDFPEGSASVEEKLSEASRAIKDGVDDLDFVCNYNAFIAGDLELVKNEILKCTQLGLENSKVVKWIIEVAALNDKQIVQLSSLIKNIVISNFKEVDYNSVFVKSSTGFFVTQDNLPNGATVATITMMLENAFPLPVKAAGGVRTYEEAVEMIRLGVKRIGTSGAKVIANGEGTQVEY